VIQPTDRAILPVQHMCTKTANVKS